MNKFNINDKVRFKVSEKLLRDKGNVPWINSVLSIQEKNGGYLTIKSFEVRHGSLFVSYLIREERHVRLNEDWLEGFEKFKVIDYVLNGEENE